MGSFSSFAQGSRRAIAATMPAAAPFATVAAEPRREGRAVGFLLRFREAAARAAVFCLAALLRLATRFAFRLAGRLRADARFATSDPPLSHFGFQLDRQRPAKRV